MTTLSASSMMSTLKRFVSLSEIDAKTQQIWLLMGGIVLLAVLLGVIAYIIRRLTLREDSGDSGGYTLSDLRRMHKEGQISDEEFKNARMLIIASSRKVLEEDEKDGDDWENISDWDVREDGVFGEDINDPSDEGWAKGDNESGGEEKSS